MLRATLLLAACTALFLAPPAQLSAQEAKSASISNVRYDLTFDSTTAAARTIKVMMTLDVSGTKPVLLSLPAWAPGHYDLINFSRRVSHFAAAMGGRSISAHRFDFDTWRIQPEGRGTVTVTFDFRADTMQTASAWSTPDFLMVNGTNVLLFPQGQSLEFAATVTVHTEPDWMVTTGMHPAGAARTYSEKSYHDLADMPFFIGRFDLDSAQIMGQWTRLATYPVGRMAGANRAAMWQALKGFVPAESAVFGVTPWDNYTVFMIFPDGFGGATALEHQSSNVGLYLPSIVGSPGVINVVAHEMFHAWNVKRLRPADMVPYHYDRDQPTPLLWVSEGFSDYYADLSEVRGGAIDTAAWAANTVGHILTVNNAPPVSVEDASLGVWVHPLDGTDFLYYDKGAMVGLLLDIVIRDATDNAGSLDGVLRALYQSTYLRGRGFTSDEFWATASRTAGGKSLADFGRRFVAGDEPLPFDSILPLAGMRLISEKLRVPRLGITSFGDSTGSRVTSVVGGGPYALAGGLANDTIIVLGGIPVASDPDFSAFRRRWAGHDGESFPIEIRRAGQPMTLTAKVVLVDRTETRLEFDPAASARALRVRQGLLHGDRKP
jgi:predicted metalloprotease with PDZ domain